MNNYQLELNNLDRIINDSQIHNQVKQINSVIDCLNKKQIIKNAPINLGILPDKLEELTFNKDEYQKYCVRKINNLLNNFRSFLSRSYGIWSLPNLFTAKLIKEQFRIEKGLEVMAGNACWSKALSELGVEMVATDSFSWAKSSKTGSDRFYDVKQYDAPDAIKKFNDVDLIICAWAPNFGNGDIDILKQYRQLNSKAILLFIGEKDGATNTPKFWKIAKNIKSNALNNLNHSFKSFDFIDERIYEIK